jgi:hypothetical protein
MNESSGTIAADHCATLLTAHAADRARTHTGAGISARTGAAAFGAGLRGPDAPGKTARRTDQSMNGVGLTYVIGFMMAKGYFGSITVLP